MRIAVIGDGLLGRSISDAAPEGGDRVIVFGHDDIEITNEHELDVMVRLIQPDVAINTAAIHRLQDCEDDPARAFAVNATGAGLLAERVPTVYVSTDYVFQEGGPHEEVLPGAQPRSAYGRSKLAGEIKTLERGGIVVRVAGLFGHHRSHKGPSFPEMLLSSHDPIRLPTDQRFTPTYAPDAARVILALAVGMAASCEMPDFPGDTCQFWHVQYGASKCPSCSARLEGIYHAVNRGPTTWAEFGEHILAYTGHERTIEGRALRDPLRPTDSSLRNTRLPAARHWAQALGDWAKREQVAPPFVSPRRAE